MGKIFGLLRLTRPANLVTAVADILAGVAVSGYVIERISSDLVWLVISTLGLYGGGVVLNDVFDTELDRVERPERPIPSGVVSVSEAAILGVLLMITGIVSASLVSLTSAAIAIAITVAAVIYDKWGKHHAALGPLNMGICRGLNLLLGISILPEQLVSLLPIAGVPVLYIAAITMISRGEVHGGKRNILYLAVILYLVVMTAILAVGFDNGHFWETAVILLFWGIMIFMPLTKAIRNPEGRMIGKAVKAGVIALILMNAAWAAAFGAFGLVLAIVLLLPISLFLARLFAVT